MKVKIGELAEWCKCVDVSIRNIPVDVMAAESTAVINGQDSYEVPDDIFARIKESHIKECKWESEYKSISEHRLAGMRCEADGDIDAAIDEYAHSITLGLAAENDMLHAYHHSFNRIFVLLDRVKRYAEEADYIDKLLSFNLDDREREKLTARLDKVKIKLEKQSYNG